MRHRRRSKSRVVSAVAADSEHRRREQAKILPGSNGLRGQCLHRCLACQHVSPPEDQEVADIVSGKRHHRSKQAFPKWCLSKSPTLTTSESINTTYPQEGKVASASGSGEQRLALLLRTRNVRMMPFEVTASINV